jgi:hypothetical protein
VRSWIENGNIALLFFLGDFIFLLHIDCIAEYVPIPFLSGLILGSLIKRLYGLLIEDLDVVNSWYVNEEHKQIMHSLIEFENYQV